MAVGERSTLSQTTQVRVEATAGVDPATGTKRLRALGIELGPSIDVDNFRPNGSKYPTMVVPNQDWSQATLTGRPTFTEIVLPLSCCVKTVTPTTPATGVYLWTFNPSSVDEDAIKTLTVEHGNASLARKATHGIVSAFSLAVSRAGVSLGGSLFARNLQTGITLGASPTSYTLVPMLATQFKFTLDTTHGALGNSKLTRVVSTGFSLSNRFAPFWAVDSGEPSYATYVETEPDLTIPLNVVANSQWDTMLGYLRNSGQTVFVRIEALGALIDATNPYRFRCDAAVQVGGVGDFGDSGGAHTGEYTLEVVDDAGWGKAWEITVQNNLATL